MGVSVVTKAAGTAALRYRSLCRPVSRLEVLPDGSEHLRNPCIPPGIDQPAHRDAAGQAGEEQQLPLQPRWCGHRIVARKPQQRAECLARSQRLDAHPSAAYRGAPVEEVDASDGVRPARRCQAKRAFPGSERARPLLPRESPSRARHQAQFRQAGVRQNTHAAHAQRQQVITEETSALTRERGDQGRFARAWRPRERNASSLQKRRGCMERLKSARDQKESAERAAEHLLNCVAPGIAPQKAGGACCSSVEIECACVRPEEAKLALGAGLPVHEARTGRSGAAQDLCRVRHGGRWPWVAVNKQAQTCQMDHRWRKRSDFLHSGWRCQNFGGDAGYRYWAAPREEVPGSGFRAAEWRIN